MLLTLAILAVGSLNAAAAADPIPLFADPDAPLAIELAADFDKVLSHSPEEIPKDPALRADFRARAALIGADGRVGAEIPIELEARGVYRLEICRFPPLKLRIAKTAMAGTPFANSHGEFKLVTHCNLGSEGLKTYDAPGASTEGMVRREFFAYRLLNLAPPPSFRVRLARIRYRDLARAKVFAEGWGFFIEDRHDLARRYGAKSIAKGTPVQPKREPVAAMLDTELAERLLGNGEWNSDWAHPDPFHNVAVLESRSDGSWRRVPYDFDVASLVQFSDWLEIMYNPAADRKAFGELAARPGVGPAAVRAALRRFLGAEAAIMAYARDRMDVEGKPRIVKRLAAFFEAARAY